MNYNNLEQRMAHAYLEMFPPFVPLAGGEVTVESQKQFYGFMKQVYQTLFDSPELFFKTLYEDDAYPNRFNKASYGKLVLYNHMKRDLKEIDDLLAQLFAWGQNGAVEQGRLMISEAVQIKKKYQTLLPHLGLKLDGRALSCDAFAGLFPAWVWMANRDGADVITFSRCMFDPAYPYMQEVFAGLFGSREIFAALAQYLDRSGYCRAELQRGPYTLDYIKETLDLVPRSKVPSGEVPLGSPLHGDPYHYGISVEYRPETAIPQFMVLRILDMKNLLLKFEQMPDALKGFVLRHAKKCDGCGYCTQTDKTGKRKPLAIEVNHERTYSICPLYPGFNFCFDEVDEARAANLTSFLDFMDRHLAGSQAA